MGADFLPQDQDDVAPDGEGRDLFLKPEYQRPCQFL
jgi:hypothetical protein